MGADVRFIVKRYIDAGWAVLPIAPGKKRPTENGWQKKAEKKEYRPEHFSLSDNIGVALGAPSDHRADVDLDHELAIAAASYLLPDTGLIHGRAGKPSSHWWYRSVGLSFYSPYKDPVDKEGLVELRAVPSHQTVIPPGVHASGEAIEWEKDGEPLDIEPEVLRKAVAHVAVAALLAKHWPREGGARHELALVCGGFMAKAMPDDPGMAYKILETAFKIAGDEEWRDRARAARETIAKAQAHDERKAEAKAAEQALDKAADDLRRAEDLVEILGEKVSVLATAIQQTKARRRARVLPDVKAEGERIAREAAAAFATLARLAAESKALKAAIDRDFVLDVTAGGYAVHAPEVAQLGSVPAVAGFLASKTFKDLTLEKWERVSK
jgi:hypothetical protein